MRFFHATQAREIHSGSKELVALKLGLIHLDHPDQVLHEARVKLIGSQQQR